MGMNINSVARIASMVGEPARTAMLIQLMDGRALTANELACAAGISPQTGSHHLAQLVDAGLLHVRKQGRHRYHRLASPEVARMLEEMMQIAAKGSGAEHPRFVVGPRDVALRAARTCYDHLAGRLGVAIADRLLGDGSLAFEEDEAGYLTDRGVHALSAMGIASVSAPRSHGIPSRAHCRPCLDWSERRFHVAGKVGALICAHCLDQRWVVRSKGSRALGITPLGQRALSAWLGSELWRSVNG
jgi:DNA-binding transcriptional ArsR family regulator